MEIDRNLIDMWRPHITLRDGNSAPMPVVTALEYLADAKDVQASYADRAEVAAASTTWQVVVVTSTHLVCVQARKNAAGWGLGDIRGQQPDELVSWSRRLSDVSGLAVTDVTFDAGHGGQYAREAFSGRAPSADEVQIPLEGVIPAGDRADSLDDFIRVLRESL